MVRPLPWLLEEYCFPEGKRDLHFRYEQPYHQIFDEDLFISENLAHTLNVHLPVFSDKQKRADQQLVIAKNGKVRMVMLSIKDALAFKHYMEANQPKHMWLIHPDGREISSHEHVVLTEEQKERLQRHLLQVAAFNGDALYLFENSERATPWLNETNTALKMRFLRLKVEKDPIQKKVFLNYAASLDSH